MLDLAFSLIYIHLKYETKFFKMTLSSIMCLTVSRDDYFGRLFVSDFIRCPLLSSWMLCDEIIL